MQKKSSGSAAMAWASLLSFVVCALAIAFFVFGNSTTSTGDLQHPLAPPNTESPRETLRALRAELDEAERLMVAAYQEHINEAGWTYSQTTLQRENLIRLHLERATRAVDLSEVAPSNRQKTGLETVMLLEEVLDRVGLRVTDAIPDAAAMRALAEKKEPLGWTVPNTEIRIARIESGPRAGEYLFTADTVSRVYDFYQKVRHIPAPDGFDFYSFYALSPGDLVPPKWYAVIQKLPPWFHGVHGDSARWQWIALVLTVTLALAFCALVQRQASADRAVGRHLPDDTRNLVLPLAVFVAIAAARSFVDELNFTGPAQRFLSTIFEVALYLPLTWLAVAGSNVIAGRITSDWGEGRYALDAGIVRVAIRACGVIAAGAILAYGASQLGVPLVGIIAGLGVGGLAVALAAQPTIENLIGGVMIYADQPVRVGELCQFGDVTGVVEEVGIRSTRIRSADRSVTTIPNADFSKARIVNLSRRDKVQLNVKLGLQYGTTEKQLASILQSIRKLLREDRHVDKEAVHFTGFASSSLQIDVSAEIVGVSAKEMADVRESLFLRLFKIIEKSGTALTAR